eukprot:GHVN01071423.1.p1 GENE.GHVN01071423.1~~GHVN01071423.1.p1  ORF type:complete len:1184 (-),score=259.63 GHVN01071423.1:146-3523(-)
MHAHTHTPPPIPKPHYPPPTHQANPTPEPTSPVLAQYPVNEHPTTTPPHPSPRYTPPHARRHSPLHPCETPNTQPQRRTINWIRPRPQSHPLLPTPAPPLTALLTPAPPRKHAAHLPRLPHHIFMHLVRDIQTHHTTLTQNLNHTTFNECAITTFTNTLHTLITNAVAQLPHTTDHATSLTHQLNNAKHQRTLTTSPTDNTLDNHINTLTRKVARAKFKRALAANERATIHAILYPQDTPRPCTIPQQTLELHLQQRALPTPTNDTHPDFPYPSPSPTTSTTLTTPTVTTPPQPTPDNPAPLLSNLTTQPTPPTPPSPQSTPLPPLTTPITSAELHDALRKLNPQATPGADGINNHTLRTIHALHPSLLAIYNHCHTHQRIPHTWKHSLTVLIDKHSSTTDDIHNWRPLQLQSSLYKTYASILTNRLQTHCHTHRIFADSQKGFLPINGVNEHNYTSSFITSQAKRLKRSLYMTYYDFADAFGSIPHSLITNALQHLGLPHTFTNSLIDTYTNSTSALKHYANPSLIREGRGVKQGCPLSSLLFLIALNPLIHKLQTLTTYGVRIHTTPLRLTNSAYADDIKTYAETPTGAITLHNTILSFISWAKLTLNPKKCGYIAVQPSQHSHLTPDTSFTLTVNDTPLPRIDITHSYKYLGIPDSFRPTAKHQTHTSLQHTIRTAATNLLTHNHLTIQQKLKFLPKYILPLTDFASRHLPPCITSTTATTNHINTLLKRCLRLGQHATTEFIHTHRAKGGLGILPLTDTTLTSRTTHLLQMLQSTDATTRTIANADIWTYIQRTHHTSELTQKTAIHHFLTSTPHPALIPKKHYGEESSSWKLLPRNLKQLNTTLTPQLTTQTLDTCTPVLCKNISQHLRTQCFNHHLTRLRERTSQGRSFDHPHTYTQWHVAPKGLSDYQYAFGWKHKLHVLPTNSTLHQLKRTSHTRCRHCTQPETAAHVFSHCPLHHRRIITRHDTITRRIIKALLQQHPPSHIITNKHISEDAPPIKPDIAIINTPARTAHIFDVTVTHEDTSNSTLTNAYDRKLTHYTPLKQYLDTQGYTTTISPIVYGTCGAIHNSNLPALTKAKLKPRYARLLQHLITTDILKHNLAIWQSHTRTTPTNTHMHS